MKFPMSNMLRLARSDPVTEGMRNEDKAESSLSLGLPCDSHRPRVGGTSLQPPHAMEPTPSAPRSKPLPDPPNLPIPSPAALEAALLGPMPMSDLALDARSLEHLADILKQSLTGVKLKDAVWLVSCGFSLLLSGQAKRGEWGTR